MRTFFRHCLAGIIFCWITPQLATAAELADTIRFTDYEIGSVENWLINKGFVAKEDASRRDRIDLDVSDKGLVIEAKRKTFGLLLNESIDAPVFNFVEIEWGVSVFPPGASYEQGVRNEAIMVYFFMGDERLSSGSLLIPDSPYFIGLFICHDDDRKNHPYIGKYFTKGGRYVCVDQPKAGELVTTRFNLLAAYRSYFDKEKDDDPAISGIAISVDTSKASNEGYSSAFVREIRIYE